jgi:hypothetical protein
MVAFIGSTNICLVRACALVPPLRFLALVGGRNWEDFGTTSESILPTSSG